MLLRLSRLLSWLAAAAGGLALFGPLAWRGRCADVALAVIAAAFVLWRAAARRARAANPAEAIPEALPFDAELLRESAKFVEREIAEAPSFEEALHAAAHALRGEIGARAVRVFLVCATEGDASISELVAARPGFRTRPRALAPGESVLARALREGRPYVDLPRALALPVLCAGSTVALLELLGIDMTIDELALAHLLEATERSLSERGDLDDLARSQPGVLVRRVMAWTSVGALAALGAPDPRAC